MAPPRFVVELDENGEVVSRLPVAREPDWQVGTEWKQHEFWWAADGGSDVAGCDPPNDPNPQDCDFSSRSTTQLTDRTNDSEPNLIEEGNLTTLGNLNGATLVSLDTMQGHYVYRRSIIDHDIPTGRITVDRVCELDSDGDPKLGWGSKYFVEGLPSLLDNPGEWWYDDESKRLHFWPPAPGNPATKNIEISLRGNGFNLKNLSYITLEGLTLEFFNENAVFHENNHTQKSYYNTLSNITLRYANRGVWLNQYVETDMPVSNFTDGFTLVDSNIGFMDTNAIYMGEWWNNTAAADSFTHSGIQNTVIHNNELHHLGFRSEDDNAIGAIFQFANQLRFEGNHVHHVAHNGVQFLKSVIQSAKEYGFTPEEIKTGEILIKDNIFEKACQLTTDCGALKIWGVAPDNHVFRDTLITGNVFRDTHGWSYVKKKRGNWLNNIESDMHGMEGFGFYADHASGIHVYRNIAYNNAYAGFLIHSDLRDGGLLFYNNLAANSLIGFRIRGINPFRNGDVNLQVVSNIINNNEGYGILINNTNSDFGNSFLDHNLYYNNGWRSQEEGGVEMPGDFAVYHETGDPPEIYPTLTEIQENTIWEVNGVEGDPQFMDYITSDHDLHDGTWPNFHLTPQSTSAIDRGTSVLPDSLQSLLTAFGFDDPLLGTAYDIGRYEDPLQILFDTFIPMVIKSNP